MRPRDVLAIAATVGLLSSGCSLALDPGAPRLIAIERTPGAWAPPSLDLTAEGTLDWIHMGSDRTTRMDREPSAFSVPSLLGDGQILGASLDDSIAVSWSNGSPLAAADADTSFLYVDTGQTEVGFDMTVEAGPVSRRARLYAGAFCSRIRLTAFFEAGERAEVSNDDFDTPTTGAGLSSYELELQSPDVAEVRVQLVISENHCASGDDLGEVWLKAVTLAELGP